MQAVDFPTALLIGGLIGGAFGAAATAVFHLSIMRSVNETLPQEEQIPVYATDWNLFFVLRKHKELYPLSKARTLMYGLIICGAVILLTAFLITWTQAMLRNWVGHAT